jgi:2-keto-4-pentenoate hydratase/2-oxohepta-3-ene-1,7-dioic acid hydratase in catechol pathway
MRYLSFTAPNETAARLGALLADDQVASLSRGDMPGDMLSFIQAGSPAWARAETLVRQTVSRWRLDEVTIKAPLTGAPSLRDFYAFEQHVATAHANRGKDVPPEWYQVPVFYFSNPNSIIGPGEPVSAPTASRALDYELEVAAIIGQPGRDIPADKALEHIFGFTIFNDWSARDLQRQEMKVGLGPAKGKDFASSLGPVIVTPDELARHSAGRAGVYDLAMVARVNGEERSRGNWADINYSFGEIIARASQDVLLMPGDIIGSGTVGTGCLLELTKGNGPWLKSGDEVVLEIEQLGTLANRVA